MASVRVFATATELSVRAADAVATTIALAVRARGRCSLALSGGETPRALYSALATTYGAQLPWAKVHVFWGDERIVPVGSPLRNDQMARETLLSKVACPEANIHPMAAGSASPDASARAYEETMRQYFSENQPRFDLVLLGLGKDAHTASLFPGGEAVRESERLVVAPWVEAQNTFRITLTPPVLNAARLVAFLAAGDDKAEPLRAVLEGPRDPERYPAQIIEGNRLWLVDRAAARLLATAA